MNSWVYVIYMQNDGSILTRLFGLIIIFHKILLFSFTKKLNFVSECVMKYDGGCFAVRQMDRQNLKPEYKYH
jgi:hypothetical protein